MYIERETRLRDCFVLLGGRFKRFSFRLQLSVYFHVFVRLLRSFVYRTSRSMIARFFSTWFVLFFCSAPFFDKFLVTCWLPFWVFFGACFFIVSNIILKAFGVRFGILFASKAHLGDAQTGKGRPSILNNTLMKIMFFHF